jgi:hypothetical protein
MGRPRSKPEAPPVDTRIRLSRVEFDVAVNLGDRHANAAEGCGIYIDGFLVHVGGAVVPLTRMLSGVKQ